MGKLTRNIDSSGLFDIDDGVNDKKYQELLNEFYKTEKNNTLYDFIEFLKKLMTLHLISTETAYSKISCSFFMY